MYVKYYFYIFRIQGQTGQGENQVSTFTGCCDFLWQLSKLTIRQHYMR